MPTITDASSSPVVEFLFLDTEFTSFASPELISVGISAQNADFYLERTDFPREKCSPFVHAEVLPKLGYGWDAQATAAELPFRLASWLEGLPATVLVLAYDYADDLRMLMHYLPEAWRAVLLPIDVRWDMSDELLAEYFDRSGVLRHHALHDARGLRHSCGRWIESMGDQVQRLFLLLDALPGGDQLSFIRTRWPELGGAHPIQALNEGMSASVQDLARRFGA